MKSVLFPNSFFSILIFLYSVLMVPLNFNNQKHLQLIDFIFLKKCFFFRKIQKSVFFRNTAHLNFSPK